MPLGFHSIHDVEHNDICGETLVDIVAVHDLHEDPFEAWTEPESGANWLRDFLPDHIRAARVVTYGYNASASALFANDAPETLQRMAECFVQDLRADRHFAGTLRRPLIFVCHGFGGVLVKKSLVYSATRTAPKVIHSWDQFVSTFAILFFGTPHGWTAKSNWLQLEAETNPTRRTFLPGSRPRQVDEGDPQVPQLIDNEFAPLLKQFHVFFFWEALPTSFGSHPAFVVDPKSAAPKLDNTEAAGIHATHSGMVKFNSRDSSSYRTVAAALATYCEEAPRIISHRWNQAELALKQLRAGEAWELGGFGFDVRLEQPFRHRDISVPRYFHLPHETTSAYIGRKDMLRTLRSAFFPGGCPSAVVGRKCFVVFGMGGSGKTELCLKFASDNKHEYTTVFTIRAASPETIRESFCSIAEVAGLEPTESAGKHFLSQQSGPWLLIIDNADDDSLDLRNLFPLGHDAHILVSTRNRDFRREGTLGSLELKGLKEDDALQLLLTKADIPRPWDVSTTKVGTIIAKALGYLALALIQAGNCVFRGVCELGGYLDIHASARSKLQDRTSYPRYDKTGDAIEVVYSTFDVSLRLLLKEETTARLDASDLLRIIGFFHFEFIPLEIFTRGIAKRERASESGPTGSWASKLVNGLWRRLESPSVLPDFLQGKHDKVDKSRINWAVAALQSLSFVRLHGQYISLHPLIHAWARDSLTISQRHLWSTIAFNTLMESLSLPSGNSSETDGDFHTDVLPHLNACLAEVGHPIPPSTWAMGKRQLQIAKICQPTLLMIIRDQVLNAAKCGYVFADRGHFEVAAMHLGMVKDILVRTMGPENERTMKAMSGLAGVYWGLGRLEEGIALQRSVVETRSRIFGPVNEETLQAMDKLGQSYWLHGQYREALELQQVTANRTIATLGAKHPTTLTVLDNLGVTLGAWRRYQESLKLHEEVLDARKKSLGNMHLETLTTKANLAMALLDLGRLEDAKAAMMEVFDQRQKQLGKEHPWTLWALCYLAKINIEMGLFKEAEESLVWGIEAGVRSLHDSHLGVLMGRGILARVYARTNRLDQAVELCLKTVKGMKISRGIAHPDYVYVLWNLAQLYIRKGYHAEAIQTCELGLQSADLRITRRHPLGRDLEELLVSLRAASTAEDLFKLLNIGTSSPMVASVIGTSPTVGKARIQPPKTGLNNPPRTATW